MNPRQARTLLAAVRAQQPSGPMIVAFFAVMHYAVLRPEEAINLRTASEQASPLARRPYDLRHARLSTWLNGDVYPPRSPSGPGTASTSSYGSTPSAWSARTSSLSEGSATRWGRTEMSAEPHKRSWSLARIWHSEPHQTASDRAQLRKAV